MKMIKAMKKLKFWSRKKRKKKTYDHQPYSYYQTSSSCHQHYYSCSSPVQPSAPPLPPWLDFEPADETIVYAPEQAYTSQTHLLSHEIVVETSPICATLPVERSQSYQQYMAPNPVYGLPVVQRARKQRASGFFGCVVSFGVNLFRCFCPCLHIREVYHKRS